MKVGICAIIKDCKPAYLREWVEWHTMIGVDSFFIYDNESAIPVKETLKDYPNVIVTFRAGKVQQVRAYNDCIDKQKKKLLPVCDWIAFIDDDEFLVIEDGSTIQEFLKDKNSSGVVLNWCTFGAEEENKSASQIDRYTKCVPLAHPQNKYIKSIVQPKTVRAFRDPHFPIYNEGMGVDIKGKEVKGSITETPYRETAWVNHYYCKTLAEFQEKIQRGRATVFQTHEMVHFHNTNDFATDTDTTIIKLKKQLMSKISADAPLPKMRPESVSMYLKQLIAYVSINLNLKESIMIEIGSFTGESTVMFAERFKQVIAIDPFLLYHEKDWSEIRKYGQDRWNRIFQEFLNRTKPYSNIKHLELKSDDAVGAIQPPIDFVYIDGLHTYEQCKKDIENYLPLIRKGGYIAGHDYSNAWPGVKQAVNEAFGAPDALFGSDGNWIVRVK